MAVGLVALLVSACIGGGGSSPPTASVAALSAMEIKSGNQSFPLTPGFTSERVDYAVTVGSNVSSVTVNATVSDSRATMKVNNQPAISGQAFGPINLVLGPNEPIVILVDGPGFSQNYRITITRAATTNLSSLAVAAGTLVQVSTNATGFTQSETNYTVQAPFALASTTVTPVSADSLATITVNGTTVVSQQASPPIPLINGSTAITIVVTAPGVSPTTYQVTVTKQQGSTNANLANLTVSPGTLAPAFAPSTTVYSATVNNVTTSVAVTAKVQVAGATLQINNQAAISETPVTVNNLLVGVNAITITVTPQTGAPQVYVITVTRMAPGNANLNSLIPTQGALSPAFAPAVLGYQVNLLNPITTVGLTPTLQDGTSSMTINGQPQSSGATFNVPNLPIGNTTVTIAVTAIPAGNTQTYTVTIVRAGAGNANLSSMVVTPGTMTPAFAAATTTYTVTALNPVSSVTITPTVAAVGSTITINAQSSASGVPLTVPLGVPGSSTPITVVVTAQEGNTQTYTVTVQRMAAGNATLASLSVTPGTMTPAFLASTTDYTVNVLNPVSSVTVTPAVAVGTSTVEVNSQTISSGGSLSVTLGAAGTPTTISVLVRAVEGNTQLYTITVNRPLPGDPTLSALTVVPGTLSPVFASGTSVYAVTVLSTDSKVTVTPKLAVSTSTMVVNAQSVADLTPVDVLLGPAGSPTPITIVVTALEGNTQTYTINVNRPL